MAEKLTEDFMIEFIKGIFKMEIANHYTVTPNSLIVDFPDHSQAEITAPQINPGDDYPVPAVLDEIPDNLILYFNYGYNEHTKGDAPNKMPLRNIAECYVYLRDACENLLIADYDAPEVIFPTGEHYVILVQPVEKPQ